VKKTDCRFAEKGTVETVMVKRLIAAIGLLFFLCLPVFAAEGETEAVPEHVWEAQKEALGTDEIEGEVESYTNGMTVDDADLNTGLQSLWEDGQKQAGTALQNALRSGVILLVLVMLCQVADGFFSDGSQNVVFLGGAAAITLTASSHLNTMMGLGRSAIDTMDSFSKVLLPTLTAASAATGSAAAACVRQSATMLFADLLITIIGRLILPMVYAYVALCAAQAALGNDGLGKLAGFVKWGSISLLTVLLLAFTAYLTISGAIAGSADAVAMKATKFTISTLIPVLGSILADATESVLAGAALLKNAVGVIGLIAVLGICLIPFLQLGIHYLIYKMTAALAGTIADKRLASLIDSISGAFGLVMGMTGACGVLLLISIASAVTMVSGG
jgi:stage III sporulation protein AE